MRRRGAALLRVINRAPAESAADVQDVFATQILGTKSTVEMSEEPRAIPELGVPRAQAFSSSPELVTGSRGGVGTEPCVPQCAEQPAQRPGAADVQ